MKGKRTSQRRERYIELSRSPFATTRTPTYRTNNRINFAARHVLLYYMEMRQGGECSRNDRPCWFLAARVDPFIATGFPIDWSVPFFEELFRYSVGSEISSAAKANKRWERVDLFWNDFYISFSWYQILFVVSSKSKFVTCAFELSRLVCR